MLLSCWLPVMVADSLENPDLAESTAGVGFKLVCAQSDLNQHLASVGRAVASRPALPVLSNVLLEADAESGRVALTAFDLNLGIRSEFEATVFQSGRSTIPARLLGDIVSRLPAGEITLEQATDDSPIQLSSRVGQYQIRGMAADDYPALPELMAAEHLEVGVESLLQGISQTLFAASHDETKQVLTGVHVRLVGGDNAEPLLEFAATDGHRLATATIPLLVDEGSPRPETLDFTIPLRTVKELERILGHQTAATLSLKFDPSQAQFGMEGHLITSRLLDGQYPDYNRLLPSQFARVVTIERRPLIEALERIAVLAAQKNDIIKMELDPEAQTILISAEAPDVGDGKESLAMQMSGESLEIAFNVKYLLDALKVFNTQDVKFQSNGEQQPVVWEPLGAMQMRYLVMPVKIRS